MSPLFIHQLLEVLTIRRVISFGPRRFLIFTQLDNLLFSHYYCLGGEVVPHCSRSATVVHVLHLASLYF